MKRKSVILVLFILYVFTVEANSLSDRTGQLGNWTLLFINQNLSTYHFAYTNASGEFLLPKTGLTKGENSNLFLLAICKNVNISIDQSYSSNLQYERELKCSQGIKFYFDGVIKNNNLDISINKDGLPEYTAEEVLTGYCRGRKNLYCSITFTNDKTFVESLNYYSNFSNYSKSFAWNLTEMGEGENMFALFQTDGNKSTLNIIYIITQKINITNPYNKEAIAKINLEKSGCVLLDGQNKTIQKLNPNESLEISITNKSGEACSKNLINVEIKIENSFNIKIGNIELNLFPLSIIGGLSILGGITFTYLYKKYKKKN